MQLKGLEEDFACGFFGANCPFCHGDLVKEKGR